MYSIKSKLPVVIVLAFMLSGWFISSCNKGDEEQTISTFLTDRDGLWRLASLRVETLHGDTSKRRDTLNTNCVFNQSFTFKPDGTCTYEDFSCLDQTTNGTWELATTDSVIFRSNMVCKDTTVTGTGRPFAKAQVLNLGQNSLVLQVVRTDTLRKTPLVVLRRRISNYGFIR
ncbi:hypothetical protein ACFQ3S_02540 [Mucilaginibacter terrae]|uniref:hypothetical protein n=1 Tax=Mucilaginibacter terrae TaxID=1955052 RepID=UPI00363140AF